MPRALTPAEVIAGEAVSGSYEQRMNDMRAIASVIANRAQQLGISPQDVVANSNEFNAYNRSLPPGVGAQIVDMAQQAIDDVAANGPYNAATFYATPAAVDNLPSGLSYETATAGHQYFSDPQSRAIGSALGYVQPNQYAFAANPTNVPTPGLLSEEQPSDWGLNPDVAPALTPTVEGWSAMASAQPVETPTQGLLSAAPSNSFSDLATAGLFGGQYAAPEDRFGAAPAGSIISQADIARAFTNPTTAAIDPSFTAGLMSASNPVVPSSVQTTSFTPSTAVASQPADLGGFASAMAAQREVAPAGLLSANHQQVQQMAETALQNALKDQQQITPSAVTAYSPTVTEQAPAVAAIENQVSSQATPQQQAAGYGLMAGVPGMTNLSGESLFGVDLSNNIVAAPTYTPTNTLDEAPALETVEVADQPTVAGPATTPAVEQQRQQVTANTNVQAPASVQTQQAAPQSLSFGQKLSNAINPGTIAGGLLGGLALGPAGGLLGGLLGNSVYGSNTGLLGGGFVSPTNQIGGGIANIASIYGGSQSPGTFAVANNGATITAQPGGYSSYTNRFGVTESIGPDGKIAADWSGLFSGDDKDDDSESGSTSSGGLFGGWF